MTVFSTSENFLFSCVNIYSHYKFNIIGNGLHRKLMGFLLTFGSAQTNV